MSIEKKSIKLLLYGTWMYGYSDYKNLEKMWSQHMLLEEDDLNLPGYSLYQTASGAAIVRDKFWDESTQVVCEVMHVTSSLFNYIHSLNSKQGLILEIVLVDNEVMYTFAAPYRKQGWHFVPTGDWEDRNIDEVDDENDFDANWAKMVSAGGIGG